MIKKSKLVLKVNFLIKLKSFINQAKNSFSKKFESNYLKEIELYEKKLVKHGYTIFFNNKKYHFSTNEKLKILFLNIFEWIVTIRNILILIFPNNIYLGNFSKILKANTLINIVALIVNLSNLSFRWIQIFTDKKFNIPHFWIYSNLNDEKVNLGITRSEKINLKKFISFFITSRKLSQSV